MFAAFPMATARGPQWLTFWEGKDKQDIKAKVSLLRILPAC